MPPMTVRKVCVIQVYRTTPGDCDIVDVGIVGTDERLIELTARLRLAERFNDPMRLADERPMRARVVEEDGTTLCSFIVNAVGEPERITS